MIQTQIASLDIETSGSPSMECLDGTVYGAKYFLVKPTWHHWDEMIEWCVDRFGPTDVIWGSTIPIAQRWYANNAKFWFREESDRTMFLLKWS